jgi:Secretion system C-terminal sorting domain
LICLGNNKTFYLNLSLSPFQSATWSSTLGLTKVSSNKNDGTFITNSSFSPTNGAEIVIDIENNCGANLQIRKRIKGIYPYTANSIAWSSYSPSACFQMVEAKFNGSINYPIGTQIFFSIDGGNTYTQKTAGTLYLPCVNVSKTIHLKLINPCGYQAIFTYNTPVYNNTNCSCKTSEELSDLENLKIDVFPNPVTTEWNLTLHNLANTHYSSVKLYDANGKEVWSYKQGISNFSNITIPASNLKTGMYLLKIVTDKQSAIYKLQKE